MHPPVIVVGAGLTGLTCALLLARSGHPVTVLDRAAAPGGRARTHAHHGALLNQGPHALYTAGPAARLLRRLGVPLKGGAPRTRGMLGELRGQLGALPVGPSSLLRTPLLSSREKLRLAKLMLSLRREPDAAWRGVSIERWLDETITDERDTRLRTLLEALVRLSTYVHAPARLDAHVALGQLRLALIGDVLYLDGGWQSLVDALTDACQRAGVPILCGSAVTALTRSRGQLQLQLRGGTARRAPHVVLALGLAAAARIAGPMSPSLRSAAEDARPVRAACLDVVLSALPRPERRFVLGLDTPRYASVHSDAARLTEGSDVVLHLACYLPAGDAGAEGEAAADGLMTWLDDLQPGWRAHRVTHRLLPKMTVMQSLPRSTPRVIDDVPGLAVAGDGCAPGALLDACLVSAEAAARRVQAADSPERLAS